MLDLAEYRFGFSRIVLSFSRKAHGFRTRGHRLGLLAFTLFWALAAHADRVFINERFPITGQNGTVLSPPHVEATNECATRVYVDSFVPHATIKVFLGGATLVGGPIAPEFGFAAIPLIHPLHTGDQITATQTVNGVTSAPSATMTVTAMPASLPPPNIHPPIYACGQVVPVHGLISGVTVKVEDVTAGTTIGTGATPNDWGSDWDPVVTSALVAGHEIKAQQSACTGITSALSPGVIVAPEPSPLTAPVLDPPIVHNDAITAHGLFTGAFLQAFDHAAPIGSGLATGDANWMHVAPPLSATSSVTAEQTLCHHSPRTPPQTPTNNIPAPLLLGPICPGQSAAFVRDTTINATLVLLKNGTPVGYGGAAPGDVPLDLAPPASFVTNDTIQVVEYIGANVVFSNKVIVGCTRVSTYHNNAQRTGWNPAENTLTPASVTPATFGHIKTVALDDQVDTQPLVVTNQPIQGMGKHSVVYVTTENSTVYAVDSWTGDILKQRNLGAAVPLPLGCPNNGPRVGINGTATIDVRAQTLYVIAYTLVHGAPSHQLHALDLATLADRPGSPVTVAATQTLRDGSSFSFSSTVQRQRPALLEANGNIYAGFGSYCDFAAPTARGWLLGWNKTSLASLGGRELNNKLATAPATVDCTWSGNHPCFLSSIWMSGYGPAADPNGSLYFTTGNSASGTYDSTFNLTESVVKLSGDLSHPLGLFTPSDVNGLDSADNDYGSGGAMVLPDQPGAFPHLAVAAGKDGRLFVLNRDSMGGFHTPDIPNHVDIGGCWCGPSYFNTSAGPRIVSSGGNTVQLWSLTTAGSPLRPAAALVASGSALDSGQDGGFFTSVSSKGPTVNTAIIWAVGRPTGGDNHVTLYAFNATPSGSTLPLLWHGPAGSWPNTEGNANIVPTVANGRVYVASNQQLQIFGLISPRFPKRFTGEVKIPLREIAPQPTGPQFWGTVKSIDGNRMVLELRSGRELQVDISAAIKEGRAALSQVGQPALVKGAMGADGIFKANLVIRAKGRPVWGEDREQ
jgi:hypothetical protein